MDDTTERALAYCARATAGRDGSHDVSHHRRVVDLARAIAGDAFCTEIGLAAALHGNGGRFKQEAVAVCSAFLHTKYRVAGVMGKKCYF